MTSMPFEELETVYDNLASAIDQVGSDKEALLLTKLALFSPTALAISIPSTMPSVRL